MLVSFIFCGNP